MATLEIQREQIPHADEAVFVAYDGRRARRLRNLALVAGVLAVLWIVGLAVGMLGFGSLPGVALVKGAQRHSPRHAEPVASANAQRVASRLLVADVRSVRREVARQTAARRAVAIGATRRSLAKKPVRRSTVTPPAAQAQASVGPAAQRTRGWSRKGYAAPRGQIRKAATPALPSTNQGRRVGRQEPLPAPAPPVAPGQAKKAEQVPPPPPPPSKNG
jgi:hypothetical protein